MDNGSENNAQHDQNKDILRTILTKCKYESVHGLQIPLELYKERVLYYTDTSVNVLDSILALKNVSTHLDLFDRAVINDALMKLYLKQESFSFIDVYENVKEKVKVEDINILCSTMKQLGYKHVNTNYGQLIVEDPNLTFERFRYIKKIKKLRESSKLIYYIDERIIDLNRTFKKPWINKTDMNEIEGYVFFHIVSKFGLEKGLFCNQANEADFNKWISDIVLSFIKPSSVIIMDNSPLHGKTVNESISKYHSKDDMLKWLQRNNIPCSPNLRKAELYDLITRCPVKENKYQLDLIFQTHGHEVLRLPRNYHDLSMTELLWEHILSNAFSFETDNLFTLKNKVYSAVTCIRQEKWLQFETIISDTEKNISAVDQSIELALDTWGVEIRDVI